MVDISSEGPLCCGRPVKGFTPSVSQECDVFFFSIQRHESISFCLVMPLGSKHNRADGV